MMLPIELANIAPQFPTLLLGVGLALATVVALGVLYVMSTQRGVREGEGRPRHWLSKTLYVAYVISIAVLAVTSFGSIIQMGQMSGYALLAHVTAAGAFVFLMAFIALFFLPHGVQDPDEFGAADFRWWAARWSAWSLVLASLAASATMLVSMLPWLGTEELIAMAVLHRYAGITVVVAVVLHLFSLTCVRLGWR